ncbi:hypothetical protein PR048_018179 [Dryococelus australis]|uniref:Uncharacterized protein n=1 Tax=Dryococelus australis TaxID=614101 RepID=A0ABQ9HC82_9NEOP|nr:hypothetical protein PR048_018179 [Dryococelus australis]
MHLYNPGTASHAVHCEERRITRRILKFKLASNSPSLLCIFNVQKHEVILAVLSRKFNVPLELTFSIDGGHLFDRVVWQRPATYCEVPTIHQLVLCLTDIAVHHLFEVQVHKQVCSPQNNSLETQLIDLLTCNLQVSGYQVLQAHTDADRKIISTAVNTSMSGGDIVINGEDTDLLVLMVALAPSGSVIEMLVPGRKDQVAKVYSICSSSMQSQDAIKLLLCIANAQKVPFQKLQLSSDLQGRAAIFNDPKASSPESGTTFIVASYGGKSHESIDELRHHLYMKTCSQTVSAD